MPLSFSTPDFFSEDFIRVLSRTLLHSLWQGMLLALVAGSIVFFTKKARPFVRYNLLTAALLCFIIGITITAFTQLTVQTSTTEKILQPGSFTSTGDQALSSPGILPALSILDKVIGFFNASAGWIVLVWLSVILLQSVRFATGLFNIYHLKNWKTFSAGEHWNKRLTELGRQLQINKRVCLLQSGIAKIPSVVGFFKPVILFPAGMLALLPPNEIEAILIHELAHIRRKDFLVNLLQHMVEIIFFFNPAVKWVSSLIRQERENCCDDIAVGQTTDKRNYINALVSFEGFGQPLNPSLVNAFGGEKDHLINRVKRIIDNNNKTLNNMEKKFLGAGLIVTSVFIFAFSANNPPPKKIEKIHLSSQNIDIATSEKIIPAFFAMNDTVPVKESNQQNNSTSSITRSQNGKKYKMVIKDDHVTELYVNGKKIPAEKISNYRSVTDDIRAQAKEDFEQSKEEMEQSESDMAEAKVNQEESEKEMLQEKLAMEQERKEMELDMEQAAKELEQSKKEMAENMEEAKKEMEQAQKDMQLSRKQMEQSRKQMVEEMAAARKRMEEAKKNMAQSKLDMMQSTKQMEKSKRVMAQSKIIQDDFIDDLVKENIIKNKRELSSYKLSNEELIVNGVKQPDALRKKFINKYAKGSNLTMEYNYSNNDEVK